MSFQDFPKKIVTFLREVLLEAKKVNWPTREQTLRNTLIVIGLSIVVAIYLGGIDFIISRILNRFVL